VLHKNLRALKLMAIFNPIFDLAAGSRVIIMTTANSNDGNLISSLLL